MDNIWQDRFLSREPAWHLKGNVFTGPMTASDACRRSKLDYIVETRPILVDLGGTAALIQDKVAIVRQPTPDDDQYRVFGIASADYSVIQNTEVAELLDQLTAVWPVETMGALGLGERTFMVLNAGSMKIKKGGEVNNFFTITEGKDAGHGLNIMFTPVKTVCQNTLTIAIREAVVNVRLPHRGDLKGELAWRVDLLERLQGIIGKVNASFELLARAALTEKQSRGVMAAAYPYPPMPAKVALRAELDAKEIEQAGALLQHVDASAQDWQLSKQRMDERRSLAWELFNGGGETIRGMEGTAWGAYNAVVEVEDYRRQERGEDALVSTLFGFRAKAKKAAFAEALAVAERVTK